jgi:hypothetical protein
MDRGTRRAYHGVGGRGGDAARRLPAGAHPTPRRGWDVEGAEGGGAEGARLLRADKEEDDEATGASMSPVRD